MEEMPPGGRSGPWGYGPFPFSAAAKPDRVEFTDEQKDGVATAFYQAEVALLLAIRRSAEHDDTAYAARTIARLTHALATLRAAAGQAQARAPFFPGPPPWVMGPAGPDDFPAP